MTNFEDIIQRMTKSDTPHFAILCGYYIGMKRTCGCCPLIRFCDARTMPTDAQMEDWLMQEVDDE